jgi:hypothetical protein
MRSFLALGVVSMVAVASMAACGDDSSDPNPSLGGTGGTGGGTGGTGGGTGGTGGGTGGTAGSGGAGGSGGAAPVAPTANCTGCVQLTVPIGGTLPTGATNFQAQYEFSAADPAQPFDLSDVDTITWRIQALTPNANFYVQAYLQNAPPEDPTYSFGFYAGNVTLAPATFTAGAWVNVVLDVGAIGATLGDAGADAGDPPVVAAVDAGDAGVILTAFDKSRTRAIGLQVGAPPTSPAGFVSVEVDSVTVTGTSNFTTRTFDANVQGLTLNGYQAPTGTVPATFR